MEGCWYEAGFINDIYGYSQRSYGLWHGDHVGQGGFEWASQYPFFCLF